jgi:hypothetical protein
MPFALLQERSLSSVGWKGERPTPLLKGRGVFGIMSPREARLTVDGGCTSLLLGHAINPGLEGLLRW